MLSLMSVLHSFLLLNNISLFGYITFELSIIYQLMLALDFKSSFIPPVNHLGFLSRILKDPKKNIKHTYFLRQLLCMLERHDQHCNREK